MTQESVSRLAVGSLLSWGAERGERLDPVAADAVVHLLALSGAKVRGGLPEATPDLVRAVLLDALPQFLSVAPGDEGAALAVLRILVDRTRADGRLNAKRHARLRDAIGTCAEEHLRVMRDPRELTLPRCWGGLLRARGVDVRDAEAVRGGLEELAGLPYAERAGLLSLPEAGHAGEGAAAWALAPYRRGLAMERHAAAGMALGQRLAMCLTESDEAPWVLDLLGSERVARLMDADGMEEWVEAATKAGLSVARRWSFGPAELPSAALPVPGPRPHDMALVTAVGEVAEQYDLLRGEEPLAAPHLLPADRAGFVSVLCGSGLLAPAAQLAASPPADADADGVGFALATGFLVLDPEGRPRPGPSLEVWRERDAGELAALAVRALVELCARLGADPDVGEEYEGEILGDLVALYGAAGETRSVAREAAAAVDWAVPPEALLAAPVHEHKDSTESGQATAGPYRLPPLAELERLLQLGELGEEDAAELESAARRRAARLDLLAAAGVVWRRGDAYGLTPLAAAVLREALLLAYGGGWPPRAGESAQEADGSAAGDGEQEGWTPSTVAERFPTEEAVVALDAERLVAAARDWDDPAAHRLLRSWLAGGEGPAARWPELLAALAVPAPRTHLTGHRRLVAHTVPDAPPGLLAGYVGDPVFGAWAAQLLRVAGQTVEEETVPLSSRLLWRLDRLHALAVPAWRASFARSGASPDEAGEESPDGADGGAPPPELGALYAGFEQAAADWPGGDAALLADLARADPFTASHTLEILADHPDTEIARPAALAYQACEEAQLAARRGNGGNGNGGKKKGKKRRKHR
ncbi:hypothetical protein [Streptomyces guryensis]|uniref:Uncharacterized protein n=1 Tax=Streptomyces guryensis TaxID=2886947 RepID=A0A9Q3Z837_9ACTN|nr:hypothetical protein [Streptomyces guryensis]MCD9878068.1 hypothetical protein [Streptomyces guryensis]